MTADAILEKMLDPIAQCLTREAARQILSFQVDHATRKRVDILAELARSGEINEEQKQEYRELVDAMDLVALLKSKARTVLSSEH